MSEPTELPPESTHEVATDSRAVEHSRRDTFRRRGGIFRLAAFAVTVAAIVFVVLAIFWTGFILGVSSGHGHEGHERGDMMRGNSEMMQDGPGQ